MRAVRLVPAALAFLVVAVTVHQLGVTPQGLAEFVAPLGLVAPLAFLALAAVRPLTGLPGIVFTLAAGFAWGPTLGTLLAASAATVGGVTAFLVARRVGRDGARRHLERYPRLQGLVERAGFRSILVIRLFPFMPYDPVHVAAGVSRMRLPAFTLATFLGTLPETWLCVAGASWLLGL